MKYNDFDYFLVMAKQYKEDPKEFIRILENDLMLLPELTESLKIKLMLSIGNELNKHSFSHLAINTISSALKCCKKLEIELVRQCA